MRRCPVCRVDLAQSMFGGVTVDGCARCGGVWFDRDELTRMARGDLSQLAAIDRAFEGTDTGVAASATGPCPVCGKELIDFRPPHTPDISLVGCPAGHGIWLREGDFDTVIARVEEWRAQRAAAPPAGRPAPQARERLRDVARALLSRNCPRCRQPNADASAVCWACGAVLAETGTLFSCPRCLDPMDHVVHQGIALNQCRVCGNLWLDQGELGALIDLPREALVALDASSPSARHALGGAPRSLPCPVCPGELREHEYAVASGIRIHSCSLCKGLWIPPDALVPIQRFVQENETYLPTGPGEEG
jgi:Zn-finger nucleic acid-binding protein